jgi:hypothetical protein
MVAGKVIELHELAEIFPSQTSEEYKGLVADIRKRLDKKLPPLIHKIVLLDGKLIDGRSRMSALLECNLDPNKFTTSLNSDDDCEAYVESANFHRRNLTLSQRAVSAASILAYSKRNAKGEGNARAKIAKAAGVSESTVHIAKAVVASPVVADAVRDGKLTLAEAKNVVDTVPVEDHEDAVAEENISETKAKAKESAKKKDKPTKKPPKVAEEKPAEMSVDDGVLSDNVVIRLKALLEESDAVELVTAIYQLSDPNKRIELVDLLIDLNKKTAAQLAPDDASKKKVAPKVEPVQASSDEVKKPKPKKVKDLSVYSEDFERFWQAYPPLRREGKLKCAAKWDEIIKRLNGNCPHGCTWAEYLILKATEYAQSPRGKSKFSKGTIVWLNGGCWEDSPESWKEDFNDDGKNKVDNRGAICSTGDGPVRDIFGRDRTEEINEIIRQIDSGEIEVDHKGWED